MVVCPTGDHEGGRVKEHVQSPMDRHLELSDFFPPGNKGVVWSLLTQKNNNNEIYNYLKFYLGGQDHV